ncbi:hypothetical protein CHELA20_50934 [Hyphomicrobiales bacterium]|nr:hypothetical protein CHELA20_50934 [Hyphomicrobiales bacterium]CAH1675233.1 hypothetical protein CHELA41_24078 [Hyphomicrobiales bacterium]
MSVAALSTEAKEAARKAGVAGNQTVLLEAAKAVTPELQVAAIRRGTEERLAAAPPMGLEVERPQRFIL